MLLETGSTPFFQDRPVPAGCRLAGWAALVRAFSLDAPAPHPACVSDRRVKGGLKEGEWTVYDQGYWPGETFAAHLGFALKHEPFDLLLFHRLCGAAPPEAFVEMVHGHPAGATPRRAWYLYELLTGRRLSLDDAPTSLAAVDLLDYRLYFTGAPRGSRRHRLRDNLLGTAASCPIIRRTPRLANYVSVDLAAQIRDTFAELDADLAARVGRSLLDAETRSSFELEGECPPDSMIEQWGRAVVEAGARSLTLDEIVRLRSVLSGDAGAPEAPQALAAAGLLEASDRMRADGVDAVLQAAAISFGFFHLQPFANGNGLLHRALIQQILAARGYTPAGLALPVSFLLLDRADKYRCALQDHPPAPKYFDATAAAELLYACIQHLVEQDLPNEIDELSRNERAVATNGAR